MFTVIPTQEILKAVTDRNLDSDGASARRKAFTQANELISFGCAQILIEGQLYEKVKGRLNEEHQKFFKDNYIIDDSAVGVTDFLNNIVKSIKWIALSEAKRRQVLILTENKQLLFGICQGGTFKYLREKSAKFINSLDFDGVALLPPNA